MISSIAYSKNADASVSIITIYNALEFDQMREEARLNGGANSPLGNMSPKQGRSPVKVGGYSSLEKSPKIPTAINLRQSIIARQSIANSPGMLSPLTSGANSKAQLNKTQAIGFTFMTGVPNLHSPTQNNHNLASPTAAAANAAHVMDDMQLDLLELETRKFHRNQQKALAAVKLQILDDFKRRELEQDLQQKLDKASRAAK